MHTLLSSHVACAGKRQWGSQASHSFVLPSSHCSGNSTAPLPHVGHGTRQPSGMNAALVGSRDVQGNRTQPPAHGPRGGLIARAPVVCGDALA